MFGVKKFHQYLYGRKFTLITDHKPLTAIFGSKKGIPTITAAHLQRWALYYCQHVTTKYSLSRPSPTAMLMDSQDSHYQFLVLTVKVQVSLMYLKCSLSLLHSSKYKPPNVTLY